MRYLRLTDKKTLPNIRTLQPFKAIVLAEVAVEPERRQAISRWLVDSGCLYVMAWGKDCAYWHADVQQANLDAFADGVIPDKKLVISTWHEDETLPQLFWFAKYTAMHPCFPLDNLLLLHLAKSGRERELRMMFEQA